MRCDALCVLSALFPSTVTLHLEVAKVDMDLSVLLWSMHRLECLEIVVSQECVVPEGLFCLLVSAGMALRPLTVVLDASDGPPGLPTTQRSPPPKEVRVVASQWKHLCHLFPCVSLEVKR